jgi:AcrR family transcriptional regulator
MSSEESINLRERRAKLTRDEILQAARRLSAERGYAGTSVRDIARAAGVSAQTVYDSVGSKQELVARLNDLIDSEADIAAIARRRRLRRPAEAAETLAALADVRFAPVLRESYGWSLDRLERWIADSSRALLLRE